ncbi:MAG TPA: c-type cytochrome [Roseiarcus sp.]|jgi:mono/diheme cytochrome c family protein
MPLFPLRLLAGALALGAVSSGAAAADEAQIQRGKYLVSIAGCSDCHTPGGMMGKSDMTRYLGGSDTGFAIPGAGVFIGQNLTPDRETGIGDWSSADIVKTLRTGKRPDGRTLSGVMPVFAQLTDPDVEAIAAFLQSLPAVKNKVAGPLKPGDKVNVFVSVVLPPDVYNALPAPKK